jgi:uncharacterized protein YecA (UPF0149 family)
MISKDIDLFREDPVELRRQSKKKHDRPTYPNDVLGPSKSAYREYRIGRNEPCPCGSGEKYKKCCLKSLKYEGYTLEKR